VVKRSRLVIWAVLLTGLFYLVRLGLIGGAAVIVKREVEQALTVGLHRILRTLDDAVPGRR